MSIKLKLIDNDYIVCADTDIEFEGGDNTFNKFLKQINEELIIGNTAYLEIDNNRFEISKIE